ncbi:response regulator [Candidatus Hydrogenedentota bacterium]
MNKNESRVKIFEVSASLRHKTQLRIALKLSKGFVAVSQRDSEERTMRRILVADDDLGIRESVIEGLGDSFEFAEAETGGEAISKVESSKFDIILLDLKFKLPDMDGMDVLEKIKAINPSTQIIIITGYAHFYNIISLLNIGANDILLKPFKQGTLRKAVKHTVDKLDRWEKVCVTVREMG